MSDERAAFLAAVVAEPEDDTRRLAFADWLDENGDPARAEFIRLQCRIAVIQEECGLWKRREDCVALPKRESEMILAHGGGWFHVSRELPTGGRVTFRRGFPHRVEVPHLSDCVQDRYRGVADTRLVPTPWLTAVVTHHPVMEVVPLDMVPWEYAPDDEPKAWGWWESRSDDGDTDAVVPQPLFNLMWDQWLASRHEDHISRWLLWDHREDATDALAEATCTFARSQAENFS